jgi:hypothetical protein
MTCAYSPIFGKRAFVLTILYALVDAGIFRLGGSLFDANISLKLINVERKSTN